METVACRKSNGVFTIFQPRMANVLYSVNALDDKFLIRTNLDAINFKLAECPLTLTDAAHWKDLVPHRTDVLLEGVDEFKDYIAISERKNGLIQLRIRNLKTGKEHYIHFNEPAYMAYVSNNPEYHVKILRYGYTSLTTPSSVYDYDMETQNKTLMKQQEVLGVFRQLIIFLNAYMQKLPMVHPFPFHWYIKRISKKTGKRLYCYTLMAAMG